jgi:hypothetical protein
MTDERTGGSDDDVDPSDWLTGQFGGEEAEQAAPPRRRPVPPPAAPYVPPVPPSAEQPPVLPTADGFNWGLTPGGSGEPPVVPPQPYLPPVEQTSAPYVPAMAPYVPYTPPEPAPQFTPPPLVPPTPDPTVALPVEPLTEAFGSFAPIDDALDGGTEVLGAQLVGLHDPVDEGLEASSIDSLFGDTAFVDYGDEPLIAALPPRAAGGQELVRVERPPRPPRPPIPRVQKILMGVAGGLVAILALIALFLLGTRISSLLPVPAAIVTPTPTPSATFPVVLPLGPVDPGEYYWDRLLGGECLDPFESAWQDTYEVVDCTQPHPAQMVHRGVFDDPEGTPYPGLEELGTRINLLCTAPTIIDYAIAGTVQDIQVAASFAADEEEWDEGNRTYFCFVNRAGGELLTASIAIPQVAPIPTPAPTL